MHEGVNILKGIVLPPELPRPGNKFERGGTERSGMCQGGGTSQMDRPETGGRGLISIKENELALPFEQDLIRFWKVPGEGGLY